MKNTILYILVGLFALACCSTLAQQNSYKGALAIKSSQLEQIGDSLRISIEINAKSIEVNSLSALTLTPILFAPKNRLALPSVVIKGRIDDQNSRREVAMMNKEKRNVINENAPYATIKGYKSKSPKTISYNQTIAFESWMSEARLDIREDIRSCGNLPIVLAVNNIVDHVKTVPVSAITPYYITPHLAYIEPEDEPIKQRETINETFLAFEVYKTDIRLDYMDNAIELGRLSNIMREAQTNVGSKIKSVTFIGYASPEGPLELNTRLAKERAASLANHFLAQFDYLKNICHIEFGGENWKELIEAVQSSDMEFKEQSLAILTDHTIDDNDRETKIKQLQNGEPHRYMLQHYYPALRKAICQIDYDVRKFNLEEAKEIIKTHPQNLSLNEMYRVANSYDRASQEFADAMETAVRTFPNDDTATLNAASAALERKDIATAERHLANYRSRVRVPQYDNAIGVLLMLKGEYDQAQISLQLASEAGLDAANQNLNELRKKLNSLAQE